jgi:hypothetical protein
MNVKEAMQNNHNVKTGLPQFVNGYLAPKTFFGQEDANVEWQDPKMSAKLFFHTHSYDEFKEPQCLFLFGRRGTGKTYLMRMLDYEANNGKIPGFRFSHVVKEEDAYHELSIQLRSSPFMELPYGDLVHLIQKKWTWVIITSAMRAVITAGANLHADNDYKTIKSFLARENLSPDGTSIGVWDRLAANLSDNLDAIDYAPLKLGKAVTNMSRQLFSPAFYDAQNSLFRLLTTQQTNCLVLIDSIEVYDLHDKIGEALATALLETARIFHSKLPQQHILVKAAFPSEVYPRLRVLNKEKTEGRNLFILWRFKDLTCLIAKRYLERFKGPVGLTFQTLENYQNAVNYLQGKLPNTVVCEQGVEFDTLAYVIRHTQKKPRQVLLLLNILYTLAESDGVPLDPLPQDYISKGIHARLDILVNGSLDIYEQVYPLATRIVMRVLHGLPSLFDYKQLTKAIPQANALKSYGDLNREDVIRLLLESGSIGVRYADGHVVGNGVCLVEAYFEYQVKGTLESSNATHFVVHPMFYQQVNTEIDMTKYVYPVPLETEEQEIVARMKINLK